MTIAFIEILGIVQMGIATVKKCDHFKLDFDTLTEEQQKAIKRILSHEDEED